jgi:amidase
MRLFQQLQALCYIDILLTLTFAVAPVTSSQRNGSSLAAYQTLEDPFPYFFPEQDASPAQLFAMLPCKGRVIEDATIDDLQQYMESGLLTSVDLATCYLQRAFQTRDYIKCVALDRIDYLS